MDGLDKDVSEGENCCSGSVGASFFCDDCCSNDRNVSRLREMNPEELTRG